MAEIYQLGDDLDALNRKRSKLEYEEYKFEGNAENTIEGQIIVDGKKEELVKAGFDVVILMTRESMYIWSRKTKPQDRNSIYEY